jgi:ABC-type lipopolysaccharide export system ATPase subunit
LSYDGNHIGWCINYDSLKEDNFKTFLRGKNMENQARDKVKAVEALEFCDRVYIMESGRVTMSVDWETMAGTPMVQKAYLGTV